MRKAFTLIEMLVVIIILPFVTIAVSQFFATFVRDVPRMTRIVEQNTTVLDLVQQLREDTDGAMGLPSTFTTHRSDSDTLLIRRQGDVICYRAEEGAIARMVWSAEGQAGSEGPRKWTFPDAVISWRLWQGASGADAVEVRTLVRQRVGSKLKDKMVNAHVFFVGGQGRED
jgi:prepilin-type N-terminal cleavage/methylation domain-containing protein